MNNDCCRRTNYGGLFSFFSSVVSHRRCSNPFGNRACRALLRHAPTTAQESLLLARPRWTSGDRGQWDAP